MIDKEVINMLYYFHLKDKMPLNISSIHKIKRSKYATMYYTDDVIDCIAKYSTKDSALKKIINICDNLDKISNEFSNRFGRKSVYGYLIRKTKNLYNKVVYEAKVIETDGDDS